MDTPITPQDAPNTGITPGVTPHTPTPPAPPPAPVTPPPPTSGAGHLDMGKILLPKKETPGHTVDSAQRINAGALLEQEITASVEGTAAQKTPEEKAAVAAPIAKPTPVAEESMVRPVETFQRDIESVVQSNNVSVLSIATAEANRRSGTSMAEGEDPKEKTRTLVRNIAMIAGGVIFLVAASGALAYLVTRPSSVPVTQSGTPNSPFIQVDAVKEITITAADTRDDVMSKLNAARMATSLSLGLMSQVLVTESSSTANGEALTPLSAEEFLTLIAPGIPPVLARSFGTNYLFGVHIYNGNQPFIILHVDSYEEAYSGMLTWERNLQQDLNPLFNYVPTQHIPEEGIATTSTNPSGQFIQTGFVDRIVENHDARVLQNNTNDIYLLWTFLDRNTLVITTNDATLREIISRLKNAPITPIPGQ